jgi:hypothetical protein
MALWSVFNPHPLCPRSGGITSAEEGCGLMGDAKVPKCRGKDVTGPMQVVDSDDT